MPQTIDIATPVSRPRGTTFRAEWRRAVAEPAVLMSALLGAATLALAAPAEAAPINLNFGAVVNNASTNTPGHAVGGITGTNWTLVTGDTSVTSDANGDPINLSVNVGKETGHTTEIIDWEATGYSNSELGTSSQLNGTVFKGSNAQSAMFVNDGGGSRKDLGVRLGGLEAGIYDLFVTARNTNIEHHSFDLFVAVIDGDSGSTFEYSGLTPVSVSNSVDVAGGWTAGDTFGGATVTVGENQDLVVISRGTYDNQGRGFLNTIQIVAVPEPGSVALLVAGATLLMTKPGRRRRAERAGLSS